MHREGPFRLVAFCSLAVTLVAVAGAFVGLDASSLWLDELFTAYFADPSISGVGPLIERAAEDVHPPGYYLVVWLANQLVDGPFDVVARGLSAALSVVALGVLFIALPAGTGRFGRLVGVAFAASSVVWYRYAQEARSYALVFVLVAVLLLLAFRIRAALAGEGRAGGLLCAFAVVGVTGGLVHYYVMPIVGGMTVMLILLAPRWRQRLAVACTGLLVLLPVAAFIAWHHDRIVVDPGHTWLKTAPGFLVRQTLGGLGYLIGSPVGVALTALLALLGLYALRRKRWKGDGAEDGPSVRDYALVIGSGVFAIALAVSVTLVVPSYSHRQVIALAPLFWALSGLVAEDIARTIPPRVAWPVAIALAALLVLQGAPVAWRDTPRKEPWRDSAAAVAALPECDGAAMPVVWFGVRQIRGSALPRFYGYYLPDADERTWIPVPQGRVVDALRAPPARNVIAARIAGTDPCPVVLWAVHGASHSVAAAAMAAINREIAPGLDVPEGTQLAIRTFSTPSPGWFHRLLGENRRMIALQILVTRDPPRPRHGRDP